MTKVKDPIDAAVSDRYYYAKRATLKEVRALYPGCVLEAYFIDSEEPERVLVLSRPDAHADHWDINVIYESAWHSKKRQHVNTPRMLNTDKWTLLGETPFPMPANGLAK